MNDMYLQKRVLVRILIGMLMIGNIFIFANLSVYATSDSNSQTEKKTEEELKKEKEAEAKKKAITKLKRIPVESNNISGWPQGPATIGESAIVMDMTTGAVLYAKDADGQKHPASITKILTALVALEHNALDKKIKVTQKNLDSLEAGASSIGLKAGEEITEEQGLYATMLASANEAAYAVAESTTGNYEEFLDMMNEKAKSLGCKNSNFRNANGLNDDAHVTTARDMALISRAAYQLDEFRKIITTMEYKIPGTNKEKSARVFQQHHKMLAKGNKNYYANATGGKTGYTSIAGNTLVTYAEKDGMKLVAVVLKESYQSHYTDTKKLFKYGYKNFTNVKISENIQTDDRIESVVNAESCVTLPKGVNFADLTAVVEATGTEEDGLGRVTYSYEDQPLGCARVHLSASYLKEIYGDKEAEAKAKAKAEAEAAKTKAPHMSLTTLPVLYYAVAAAWLMILIVLLVLLFKMGIRKKG